MSIHHSTGKTLIVVLSAILMDLGGYNADIVTNLLESNHKLSYLIQN